MKKTAVALLFLLALVAVGVMVASSHAAMAKIQGQVYWFDQYGNLRPLSWAQVVAENYDGSEVASTTTDGSYVMWVAPGTYNVTASLDPGYTPVSHVVTVSDGGIVVADFELEPSGEPIPEYPPAVQSLVFVIAAFAAAVLLRRRSRSMSNA
jgi:hypothetical protein